MYKPQSYLNGFTVTYSEYLTKDGEPQEIKRTLKERWFTRPWNPLKKTRTVIPQVPRKEFVMFNNTICAHPALKDEIDAIINTSKKEAG